MTGVGCKPLTNQEISRLLPYLTQRDATWFQLGLKTGFRISELLSIKLADLFEYGTLKTELLVARKNMKGKKRGRVVPLSVEAQGILMDYIHTLPKDQTFLFESNRGQLSRSQAWRGIKAAVEKAGLKGKIATHSPRKTLANRAYKASDKDLALVQRILGHSSIQSTIAYLNVEPENLNKVWKEIQK
jgi:integrase